MKTLGHCEIYLAPHQYNMYWNTKDIFQDIRNEHEHKFKKPPNISTVADFRGRQGRPMPSIGRLIVILAYSLQIPVSLFHRRWSRNL